MKCAGQTGYHACCTLMRLKEVKKKKKKDSYETGNKFTELDLVEIRQQFLKMHICDKGCLEYLT